jgi:hypothetical protein
MLNIGNKRIRLTKFSNVFGEKYIDEKVTTLIFTFLIKFCKIKDPISNNFVLKLL